MRFILLLCIVLSGCSGYRVVSDRNPFEKYGIKSISVPAFVSHASIDNVSAPMTKEIHLLLSKYSGLSVYSGEDHRADAVLVGIVSSDKHRSGTIVRKDERFVKGEFLGARRDLYVSSQSHVALSLSLTLIRNPNWKEIKSYKDYPTNKMFDQSDIVFSKSFGLSESITRVVVGNTGPDSGGVVNLTKNKALVKKAVDKMAEDAAVKFKDIIINAF